MLLVPPGDVVRQDLRNTQALIQKGILMNRITGISEVGGQPSNNEFKQIVTKPGAATRLELHDDDGGIVQFPVPGTTITDTVVYENLAQILTNKTLTAPAIADFTSANHDHSTPAQGGTIAITDTTGTLPITRLGAGANGQLLETIGGVPTWTATPTLANFTNANHTHQSVAQGGTLDAAAIASGIIPEARGGTGEGTYIAGDLLYSDAVDSLARRSIGGVGTLLKVSGGLPVWATHTWNDALTQGAVSGAISPQISAGQQLLIPSQADTIPGVGIVGDTDTGVGQTTAGGVGTMSFMGDGNENIRVSNANTYGATTGGTLLEIQPDSATNPMMLQFDSVLVNIIQRMILQPRGGNHIASFFLAPSGTQTRSFFQMRSDSSITNSKALLMDMNNQRAQVRCDNLGAPATLVTTFELGEANAPGGGRGLNEIGFYANGNRVAWINLDAATPIADVGQVRAGAGVVAEPGWSFDIDIDLGVRRVSANTAAFMSNSAEIARWNATGWGFFGATPVGQSAAYTPTNVTPDRAYDANVTTLNELADVVGTVIADLQAIGIFG